MSKSNQKINLSLVSSRKSNSKILEQKMSASVSKEEAALEQLASVEFWKNEIIKLKGEEFESISKAVEKVVQQVLERLQLHDEDADTSDVKEFLRLVFDSSEALQSALRKSLTIRS